MNCMRDKIKFSLINNLLKLKIKIKNKISREVLGKFNIVNFSL